MAGTTITPNEDGSLHVEGDFTIELSDGTRLASGGETWLCRCGQSDNKPFCDGSHGKVGFSCGNDEMRDADA